MIFFDDYQKEMLYLGSNSGANVPDKIEQSGLHITKVDGQPTFEEGKYVLICKTLYKQDFEPKYFEDSKLVQTNYPDKDFSTMYIAEIEAAYEIEK